MKVKIVKCSRNKDWWYCDKIGIVGEVLNTYSDDYDIKFYENDGTENGGLVAKEDCIIIENDLPKKVTEEWARKFLKDAGYKGTNDDIAFLKMNKRIICKSAKEELDEFYKCYKPETLKDENNFVEKATFRKLYELAIKAIEENK